LEEEQHHQSIEAGAEAQRLQQCHKEANAHNQNNKFNEYE